jgi:hypothetical protein
MYPGYANTIAAYTVMAYSEELSQELCIALTNGISIRSEVSADTYVRSILINKFFNRLDPATYTPYDPGHMLHKIESAYSQSVFQGNREYAQQVGKLEQELLRLLERAEESLGVASDMEVKKASEVRGFLRQVACFQVKRHIGVTQGYQAYDEYLKEYQASIRNRTKLDQLSGPLRIVLGQQGFGFRVTESFGQPVSREEKVGIVLESGKPGIMFHVAPAGNHTTPSHDLPSITVYGHSLPITFDLYLALRLVGAGCANSSLPASVRAALDRIYLSQAGANCRDRNSIADGTSVILVSNRGKIVLEGDDQKLAFRSSEEN